MERSSILSALMAVITEGRAHLVREVADLVFHTMVPPARREANWSEVESELARWFRTIGTTEKESKGRESAGPA